MLVSVAKQGVSRNPRRQVFSRVKGLSTRAYSIYKSDCPIFPRKNTFIIKL